MSDFLVGTEMAFRGLLAPVLRNTLSMGANTLQFSLGNHISYSRSRLSDLDIAECIELTEVGGIHCFTHAPLIFNLAGSCSAKQLAWTSDQGNDLDAKIKSALQAESSALALVNQPGRGGCVIHPGTFYDRVEGLKAIVRSLDRLQLDQNARLMLEISSGSKGDTKLAKDLDELQYLIYSSRNRDHLFACIDTCHIFVSGEYNFQSPESMYKFGCDVENKLPGKIGLFHVNDSAAAEGSYADRHHSLGWGKIWGGSDLSGVYSLVTYAKEKHIPLLMEANPMDLVPISIVNQNLTDYQEGTKSSGVECNPLKDSSREQRTEQVKEERKECDARLKACKCVHNCRCEINEPARAEPKGS